jgi:hypothetical protein
MKAYENYQRALRRLADAERNLTHLSETIRSSRRAALAAARGMRSRMTISPAVLGADHEKELAAATREVVTSEGARQYWRAVHAKAADLIVPAKREARAAEVELRKARREFWDERLSSLLAEFYEAHRAELVHIVAAIFRQDEDISGTYPAMNIFRLLQIIGQRVDIEEIRADAEEAAENALSERVHLAASLEGRDRAAGYHRIERITSMEVGTPLAELDRKLRVIRGQIDVAETSGKFNGDHGALAEMMNQAEELAELIAEREAVL